MEERQAGRQAPRQAGGRKAGNERSYGRRDSEQAARQPRLLLPLLFTRSLDGYEMLLPPLWKWDSEKKKEAGWKASWLKRLFSIASCWLYNASSFPWGRSSLGVKSCRDPSNDRRLRLLAFIRCLSGSGVEMKVSKQQQQQQQKAIKRVVPPAFPWTM
jgi:hypothetical protein